MQTKLNLHYFILLALSAYILRLLLANFLNQFTVFSDLTTFRAWGIMVAENGFKNFYSNWSDYLPGYLYILSGLAIVEKWLVSNNLLTSWEILYKLPSILADIGIAFFIYLIARKFISTNKALLISSLFMFNPSIFANSTLWGQADSFMTFFLISSFYFLLERKFLFSAILLGLGQIIKPIALFSLPVYILYMLKTNTSVKQIAFYLFIFSVIIIIAFIPFNQNGNLFSFIIERHSVTANTYPYTSVNAFNLWSVITKIWSSDNSTFIGITLHYWGYILFGLLYLTLSVVLIKSKSVSNFPLLFSMALTLCYIGMFILLTRMHERHIFYGLGYLSILLASIPKSGIILAVALFLVHLVNLYYPYSQATLTPLNLPQSTIIFLSLINVFVFLYFILYFIKSYAKKTK